MKVLAVGLICLVFAGQSLAAVTVTGEGTVSAQPDMATFRVAVVSENESAAKALDANNAAMTALMKNLKELGVKDLSTNGFSVNTKYKKDENVVAGYVVSNHLVVKVDKLDTLGKVLDLAARDGNRVNSVSFSFKDSTKLLDKARAEAIADAKRKAELYASSSGIILGRVVKIEEQTNFSPRSLMRVSPESGFVPVEVGAVSLKVSVQVEYSLGRKNRAPFKPKPSKN
jgi:uncharacterized protein YggE